MPLNRYGVLAGRVIDRRSEGGTDTPHYQIHVRGGAVDFRVAVNVLSQQQPSELLYGLSYLQPGIWQRLTAGQAYVTPSPEVHVRVAAIDSAQGTASLRIWDLPEGCLRKEDSKPKVYLIENGKKRWVTSPAVLFALGKSWADVRSVPDGALTNVPDGPDVVLLGVSVSPHPVPVNRSVTVTVNATNVGTGAAVAGQVLVDGKNVGTTGTPFTHTFRTRRIRIPGTVPPEFEVVYPTGIVRAASFPDTPIDFGFPDT